VCFELSIKVLNFVLLIKSHNLEWIRETTNFWRRAQRQGRRKSGYSRIQATNANELQFSTFLTTWGLDQKNCWKLRLRVEKKKKLGKEDVSER